MQKNSLPTIRVSLASKIAPVFYPVHTAVKTGSHTYFWLKGGRGSTKSSFVALQIVKGIIDDPLANAIVIRKVADTIRDSVLANLTWAIEELQMSMFFKITNSPASITYLPTGQKIIMKGLDKPGKLKSIKVRKGYFKFLWFEEADELKGPEEMRSVQQSVIRGGARFVVFVTYNPPNDPNSWVNSEAARRKRRPDHYIHHSTYLDVDPAWLGEQFIIDAQELERDNILSYQHEYLGIAVGRTDSIIFGKNTRVADFDIIKFPDGNYRVRGSLTDSPGLAGPYYGADFGFANDPNTLVKLWIDDAVPTKKKLYVEYEWFGHHVKNDDIPDGYDTVPGSRRHKISADSARPETIAHLKDKGFDMEGAEKGEGSVEDGITWLQSCDIIIHPRCDNIKEEARLYVFKVDRLTLEVLPDIVDKHNHGWDAIRYALWRIIKYKPKGFFGRGILKPKK